MRKGISGFTIVELLIVIVVIAILAAVSIVAYTGMQRRARDSIRIADMKQIQKIVESYKAVYGSYPLPATGSGNWAGNCTSYGSAPTYIVGVGEFASSLPFDPSNGTATVSGHLSYLYNSNGTDYMALTHSTMETICDGDPSDACNSADIRAMDRVSYTQPTIAVYSPGGRLW